MGREGGALPSHHMLCDSAPLERCRRGVTFDTATDDFSINRLHRCFCLLGHLFSCFYVCTFNADPWCGCYTFQKASGWQAFSFVIWVLIQVDFLWITPWFSFISQRTDNVFAPSDRRHRAAAWNAGIPYLPSFQITISLSLFDIAFFSFSIQSFTSFNFSKRVC